MLQGLTRLLLARRESDRPATPERTQGYANTVASAMGATQHDLVRELSSEAVRQKLLEADRTGSPAAALRQPVREVLSDLFDSLSAPDFALPGNAPMPSPTEALQRHMARSATIEFLTAHIEDLSVLSAGWGLANPRHANAVATERARSLATLARTPGDWQRHWQDNPPGLPGLADRARQLVEQGFAQGARVAQSPRPAVTTS